MNWRRFGSVLLAGCLLLTSIGGTAALADNAKSLSITNKTSGGTVIVLDPGHGGTENGASAEWNGTTVYEKDLNAAIANYCKQALENNYDGVTVYLTHTESETLSLSERAKYAASVGADIMVSIHCNAAGDAQSWTDGAEALVPNGNYRSGLANTAVSTATAILASLHENTGIVNRGLIRRNSSSSTYPNGKTADYYGLIRNATLQNVACTIVEHAFLDDEGDYTAYLSDDDKLRALGEADAAGIASAFGLQKRANTSAENGDTPFTDVQEGQWFYDEVTYVYQNELMHGTSATTFEPSVTTTRAMAAQILYNCAKMQGEVSAEGAKAFSDVAADAWYAEAIAWASATGVVMGVSETLYEPNREVTRQEFACMLCRYIDGQTDNEQTLAAFPDAGQVASWAQTSMQWAVASGIIAGTTSSDGTLRLNPTGVASRAELATMLHRFYQGFVQPGKA